MEKTFFDVRSEMVFLSRKIDAEAGGQRFPRQLNLCRSRGVAVKSSYPVPRTANEGTDFVATKKVLQSECMKINGNSHLSSSCKSYIEDFVLEYYEDEYDGIVINQERLPKNAHTFACALRTSLSHWALKGKKGVWLKLPADRSEFVPIAIKEGFMYHHAEPSYVMLTYWIPDEPCFLPANASHSVGVGGFVINDKDEVLVVQEKHSAENIWKLPTGFIHESEEIFAGAVREVKEETGIDTEFVEVIAFRHAHQVTFEKSDLFFICMLKPLSSQIVIDDIEVKAAKLNFRCLYYPHGRPVASALHIFFLPDPRLWLELYSGLLYRLPPCLLMISVVLMYSCISIFVVL